MNGGYSQRARVMTGVFADKLPPSAPSMAFLCKSYAHADANWTPESDGLTHEIAKLIRERIMRDYGLTEQECDALGEAL